MYGVFKSADDDIMDMIDSDNLQQQLSLIFELKGDKLETKLKKVIKDRKKFYDLVKELKLSEKEFIYIMTKAYPNIFNHRLIKFIRKTYLFLNEEQ